jgi:hypothetical protein
MAKLFRPYMDGDSEILFKYELDEELPVWGETITMRDDEMGNEVVKVTVGKKLYNESFIAAYEVLASRAVTSQRY